MTMSKTNGTGYSLLKPNYTENLYKGPIPPCMVKFTPTDDLGQVIMRGTCLHAIIQAVRPAQLLDLDGSPTPEYVNIAVGVMGGKPFRFEFEDDLLGLLEQLDAAEASIVLEKLAGTAQPTNPIIHEIPHVDSGEDA